MKKVQVLLAAYNGAKYISQQIDSILRQKKVCVSLLIRDDGSSDGTWEILQKYEREHADISVYTGERKGAAGSFFDLLQKADPADSYFAFADQDDVWHPYKLARAVKLIEKNSGAGRPLLYAGKVVCVSQDLLKREMFSYKINREASFGNALVENICMGCTEVFNRELLKLVRMHIPSGGVMHDWWMYLTASYFGTVIYDPHAYMLYRQHADNAVGMHNCWAGRWKSRILRIRRLKHRLSFQAREFRDIYARLIEDDTQIRLLCSYRSQPAARIRLACSKQIYRQNAIDDAVYRLLFLIGFL